MIGQSCIVGLTVSLSCLDECIEAVWYKLCVMRMML